MMNRKKTRSVSSSSILVILTLLLLGVTQIESTTPWKSGAPCRTFIWDAPSAWRYALCKRLLRGRIYEGLGGKKFVRIKPYSVLSSLYPLSNHGPSRCFCCGHSFENHLRSWWFPFLYTPYDRHLDETYENYTIDPNESHKKKNQKVQNIMSASKTNARYSEPGLEPLNQSTDDGDTHFRRREFHKRYAEDITNEENKKGNNRRSQSTCKDKNYQRRGRQMNTGDRDVNNRFQRKHEIREMAGIKYRVPSIDVSSDEHNLSSALVLALVRTLVLERFDNFIGLQDREHRWHDWKVLRGL